MPIDLKSPQQQIYDAVFIASLNLGYSTYDYLPANEVKYPFVYIGEQFDNDLRTKTSIYGNVQQRVHLYHTYRDRREITTMMDNLKSEFRKLKRTENFNVTCKSINAQTLPDNSSSERLLHGIIEVEFQFN